MEDERKSRKQLLRELARLRRKVAELATSEAERKRAEEALASYREGLEELVEERTSRLMEASARLEQELAECKRIQEALAAERNLLRTLMDNLPDPVVVKDLEERYVLANPAQARLFGLEGPQELVGKTFFDLYPEGLARPYPHGDDQQVLRSGEPLISREQMVIDADGQERWFLTSKVPLRDDSGSVVGLVGVSREITERKRAEEALREYSERLEEMVEERTRELREAQEELLRNEKLALLGEVAGAMSTSCATPGSHQERRLLPQHGAGSARP